MAAPLSAPQFRAALKAERLTVVERAGWSTNRRPTSTGSWGPLNGVMIHHTASGDGPGIVGVCYSGRSDLPGPLCHGVIHRDGSITLVGWGRANHAGLGDDDALAAVINESGSHPAPNEQNVDGNARFVGFECVNRGTGSDPWPEVQLDAIARAAAAVCRAYGWGPHSVIGHLEWTNQKIDPRGFSMSSMRARVAALLAGPAGGTTQPPQEDDMPHYLSIGRSSWMTVAPDVWDAIEFTEEWSDPGHDHWDKGGAQFVAGPALFNGQVGIRVDGLPEGAQLQVMLSEVKDGKYVKDHDISEVIGTDGDAFQVVPLTGSVPPGRGMRVRVKHWEAGPVRIQAYVKALIWA